MEQLEIPGTSPFTETNKHYHIGSNMVGYLPEGDIMCADNVQDAVQFFLSRLQDAYEECEDECTSDGCTDCEWHKLAQEIDNIRADAKEGTEELQRRVLANGGYHYMYLPPEGADIHYWIEPWATSTKDAAEGKFSRADICEINMEQNDLLPFDYWSEAQNGSHHYWGSGHHLIHADRTVIGRVSKYQPNDHTVTWFAYPDYTPPTPGKHKTYECVGSHLPSLDAAARALWVAYKARKVEASKD
jgi:hypothetical protein